VAVNQGSVQNYLMDRIMLFSLQNFSVAFWNDAWLNACGLAAFGALAAWGLLKYRGGRTWFPKILAGLCLLPLAVSLVVSLLSKPMYSDRAMLVSALCWQGLAGLGISRLPQRGAWAAWALLLAMSLFSLGHYYFDPSRQRVDYMPAWKQVTQNWKPGDSIFHQNIYSYYAFKFYAIQEARHPETSPYRDEPGAALGPESARVPGQRPNWIHTPPPPFSSNEAAGRFRAAWRKVNAWLSERGMGIHTGYNRDFVYTPRLEKEALPGVKRIWYLETDRAAEFRIWMPQMNVYRHGIEHWDSFGAEDLKLAKKGFKQVSREKLADVNITLFEKIPGRGGKPK
jgi:hypothetical protein